MRVRCHRRGGFTLVELLVVIGIIAVLFALTAIYFATFNKSHNVNRGTDQLSGWLLVARQQARRDMRPTGVRFIVGADNFCRTLQYIQQPDDFAQGVYVSRAAANQPSQARLRLGITTAAEQQAAFPVQAGDYLEIYGGGVLRQVVSPAITPDPNVATNGEWILALNPSTTGGVDLPQDNTVNPPVSGAPTNYRIIPQPRPIAGEHDLNLPEDVAIDFNFQSYGIGDTDTNSNRRLSNPPVRGTFYEILFGPSGAVIGQGTSATMSFLWVRRAAVESGTVVPDNSSNQSAGYPIIVSVQSRTGFIAQHPVPGAGDAYRFARDGKSSGM